MAANTILLKGDLGTRHEEYRANAALSPGHLLTVNSAGKVLKHPTSGGVNTRTFAKEDALRGKTINDAYATDDLVPCHLGKSGDKVQARIPAAAVAIVIGDLLMSDGTGCLIKVSGGGTPIGYAAEAVDNSAGGAEVFCAVWLV